MIRTATFALACVLAVSAFADGTVTTPSNIAPTTWKVASINMVNGAGSDLAAISITIYYFDASNNVVSTSDIALAGAEFTSFFTVVNSAVAGESGSAIKRFRMRVSKWLIDNGKISNVTPEA